MPKSKFNPDYIFIVLLGLLIANTLYGHVNTGYLLSYNNYAAFASWVIALLLIITKVPKAHYAIPVLLLLGLFGIFNFMAGTIKTHIGIGDTSSRAIDGIEFNPVILLICIIYYFVNRKTVSSFLSKHLNDSDEQRRRKQDKLTAFYYDKFTESQTSEFEQIINNYDSYPAEAKLAIDRIKIERNI